MTSAAPLALFAAPLLAAAAVAVLRQGAGRAASLGSLAFVLGLLARGPAGRSDFLGLRLELGAVERLVLVAAVVAVGLAELASASRSPGTGDPARRGTATGAPGAPTTASDGIERVDLGSVRRRAASGTVDETRLVALGLAAAALLVRGSTPIGFLLVEAAALVLAVGIARAGRGAASASGRYLVTAVLAGLALVVGSLLVAIPTDLREPAAAQLAAGLVVAGLAGLAGVLPLHSWLAGFAESGRPEDAPLALALTAGPAGVLAAELLRGHPTALPPQAGPALLAAGLASAFLASLLAVGLPPARRLAALASASLALALVGLSDGSDFGLASALLGLLATPPTLFLGLFCLREAGHSASEADPAGGVAGLAGRQPGLAGGLAVSALSLAGVPLLAGFPARWAVGVIATVGDGYLAAALCACVLGGLAAGQLVYSTLRADSGAAGVPLSRLTWALLGTVGISLVAFGLYPAPLVDTIQVGLLSVGIAPP